MKIADLTSRLSEGDLYKEMYEKIQRELDSEQRNLNEQLVGKDNEINEINARCSKKDEEIYDYKD